MSALESYHLSRVSSIGTGTRRPGAWLRPGHLTPLTRDRVAYTFGRSGFRQHCT